MKKKIMSFVLSLAMLATCAPFVQAAETEQTPQIKNIIYLIPDGGGFALYDFANMVKEAGGFDKTKFPNATPTDTTPLLSKAYLRGSETTHSTSAVTDSAAGGTALSSGYKTNNGYIGVDTNYVPHATILEGAQSLGKAAGLVSTVTWQHATPASFSAHAEDRNDYRNIYQQQENQKLDVVLPGGYGAVADYATIQNAVDRGYTIINNKEELAAIQPGDKVWGNIVGSSMGFDYNKNATTPNLAELTMAAITALSGDEDGFFLMVEGSYVDSGGHSNDAVVSTSEYLAFDAALNAAVEWAKGRNDTIVVGAPDHDTGGMDLMDDMTAEVAKVQVGTNPTTINWSAGGNHSARNCPVWLYVPEGIDIIEGLNEVAGDSEDTRNHVIDNTDITKWLQTQIGVDLDELSKELFVDVTSIGQYKPSTERFVFNNGDKYIYRNQSWYYKDGEKIDLDGEVAVYLNGKFYVPAAMIEEADWDYVNEEVPDTIEGLGTSASPYIIESNHDFLEFIGNLVDGNDYSGKYLKQTANIDLSNEEDFLGLTSTYTFAGTYDGNGYKLTVGYETTESRSPFPYVTGTIMNLGVDGSITTTGTDAVGGIARSLRTGGKIVNCYVNANMTGPALGGIAGTSYGAISNSYFGGTLTASSYASALANNGTGGTFNNCYYVEGCGAAQSTTGVSAVSEEIAKSALAERLNDTRAAAATDAGVDEAKILYWEQNGLAVILPPIPKVTDVVVKPGTIIVGRGDSYQFTATVNGLYNPAQTVGWTLETESECAGTYITDDGLLYVDENETVEQLTILAKSKVDGSKAGFARITVGDETVLIEPDGTAERPFLIENEDDFYQFTKDVLNGKYNDDTSADIHFKQTANLDMADYFGYSGIDGTTSTAFYGVYDGDGHTINLAIESDSTNSLFSHVYGTVMNLGTTGTITNTTGAGGICYFLRKGGAVINCWSTVDITTKTVGGITPRSQGLVANCYYDGTLTATTSYPIAKNYTGGSMLNNYYVADAYAAGDDVAAITQTQLEDDLHNWLNESKEESATAAGLELADLNTWVPVGGAGPIQVDSDGEVPEVTVTGITLTADTKTAKQGKGVQLTKKVTGENGPSQRVTWTFSPASGLEGTYVDEAGYLHLDYDEPVGKLTVTATSVADTNYSASVTITVEEAEPDGTKARPYLITNEADFHKFTQDVLGGNTFEGLYFKQTADLDMAGYSGYNGMGSAVTFAGIYDGDGYTINVNIAGTGGESPFPYVTGMIMNLGTTGVVNNSNYGAGGIARSLRSGGIGIVNCWSTVNVTASAGGAGGITSSNNAQIANCYYNGTVCEYAMYGTKYNCFDRPASTTLMGDLYQTLNDGLATSATKFGIDVSDLKEWVLGTNGPVLVKGDGTEESDEIVTTLSNVAYADGSVTGTITLTQCPEEYVAYVAIFNGTQMVAAQKQAVDSTSETFAITYTPADGTTYTVKLMLWDDGMAPCAAPATASVAK